MNNETLKNWVKEKKTNFNARVKLHSLDMKGANGYEGMIHRDGENIMLSKSLNFSGYGDNVYAESRAVGGPADVNVRVTCNGNTMDVVTIRNRK